MIRIGNSRDRCADAFGLFGFGALAAGVVGCARLSVLCSLVAIAAGLTFLTICARSPRS